MRKPTALIGTLLLTAGLAACGDDGDDTATEEPAASASAPTEAGEAAEAGGTVTVEIGDFVYDPTPVELTVGQSIVWENVHTQAHTATGQGDLSWDTGNIAAGESSDPVLFDEPGSFTYICALHPFMEATVEVSA